MQKPTVGVPRPDDDGQTDREQAPATSPLHRLTSRATRVVRARARDRMAAVSDSLASSLRPFTTAERALPIAVASIVAVAALLAFLPVTPQGAVSGIQGSAAAPRLAVNGGIDQGTSADALGAAAGQGTARAGLAGKDATSFQPLTLPSDVITEPIEEIVVTGPVGGPGPAAPATAVVDSAVQDDGTLLTGYAPETTVEDGADLIRTYSVQKGDTLRTIAKQFDVSTMTLWWANKLKKKDLTVGRVLRIPPVSGLVYTVKETDTLDTVAAHFKVDGLKIIELNGLEDPTLVVGQVLVLPGAKGAPMPTPKPVVRSGPASSYAGRGGGPVLGGGPTTYPGGAFKWPVVGGNNYISQYFHYGHYGVDIAADFGSKVIAAAPGKVIFAGWKSNGGGWQVWISHGSGIYTTYNHMSAYTVASGQSVARGAQVGKIGQSGNATGPHLHFEVWNGRIWDGGTRVNPLKYF